MNLIIESFKRLFPDKQFNYTPKIKYSKAFKGYNANIKLYNQILELRLSYQWKPINKEIQIGLIQSLLLKLFKTKKQSNNVDFYNNFIKNVHIAIPKVNIDPTLQESFNRVNEQYFNSLIDQTNLILSNSINKLGSYEYGSDTITISKYLLKENQEMVDYVMYHEMLHKKYKLKNKNNRNYHHTKLFREKEQEFKNSKEIEKKLKKFVYKYKFKKALRFW